MPYYRHEKDSEPDTGEEFATRQEAMTNWDKVNERITFVPTEVEKLAWRQREQNRFYDGTYVEVPWNTDLYRDHYVHLSVKAPGLIAYTASEEKGRDDKQTQMRPGKYLEQFYSMEAIEKRCIEHGWAENNYYKDVYQGMFTPEQVADYITRCQSEFVQLQFAATPDEIEQVYLHGPESCMSHPLSHYSSSEHPVRVYGDSDLQVAYLGDLKKKCISARAVVWPERKVYGSTYGTEQVLAQLLETAGFKRGSFRGAKIRAIPDDNSYIMPYLDVADLASLRGQWFVLDEGDYGVKNTNGLLEESFYCQHDNCDSRVDGEDQYCYSCLQERWTCHFCGEESFDEDGRYELTIRGYYGDGRHVWACESCRDDKTSDCKCCDESFVEAEYPWSVQRRRLTDGITDVCAGCEQNGATKCEHCRGWHLPEDDLCEERLAYEEAADERAEANMVWEGAAL
jgi:hypothetical protein